MPYQTFASSDGHLILACGNDGQFRALCGALGLPELALDARFAENSGRSVNRVELLPILEAAFRTRTRDEWIDALEACGVPCGPINDVGQAFDSDQARHRQAVREIAHPVAGVAPTVASPLRLSATPVQYNQAPPMLGRTHGRGAARRAWDGRGADRRAGAGGGDWGMTWFGGACVAIPTERGSWSGEIDSFRQMRASFVASKRRTS